MAGTVLICIISFLFTTTLRGKFYHHPRILQMQKVRQREFEEGSWPRPRSWKTCRAEIQTHSLVPELVHLPLWYPNLLTVFHTCFRVFWWHLRMKSFSPSSKSYQNTRWPSMVGISHLLVSLYVSAASTQEKIAVSCFKNKKQNLTLTLGDFLCQMLFSSDDIILFP